MKEKIVEALKADPTYGEDEKALSSVGDIIGHIEKKVVRKRILDEGTRIDGRDTKTVRPIEIQPGILPRAHGSALFTRGETQSLCVTTLRQLHGQPAHGFAHRRRDQDLHAAL